jgi:hypothetical protein
VRCCATAAAAAAAATAAATGIAAGAVGSLGHSDAVRRLRRACAWPVAGRLGARACVTRAVASSSLLPDARRFILYEYVGCGYVGYAALCGTVGVAATAAAWWAPSVIVSSAPTTVPPRVHHVTRHAALHAYQEHLNSNDRLVKRNASIYLSTERWILEWYRGLMRLKLKW